MGYRMKFSHAGRHAASLATAVYARVKIGGQAIHANTWLYCGCHGQVNCVLTGCGSCLGSALGGRRDPGGYLCDVSWNHIHDTVCCGP